MVTFNCKLLNRVSYWSYWPTSEAIFSKLSQGYHIYIRVTIERSERSKTSRKRQCWSNQWVCKQVHGFFVTPILQESLSLCLWKLNNNTIIIGSSLSFRPILPTSPYKAIPRCQLRPLPGIYLLPVQDSPLKKWPIAVNGKD